MLREGPETMDLTEGGQSPTLQWDKIGELSDSKSLSDRQGLVKRREGRAG